MSGSWDPTWTSPKASKICPGPLSKNATSIQSCAFPALNIMVPKPPLCEGARFFFCGIQFGVGRLAFCLKKKKKKKHYGAKHLDLTRTKSLSLFFIPFWREKWPTTLSMVFDLSRTLFEKG